MLRAGEVLGMEVGEVWPGYHTRLGDRGLGAGGSGPQTREPEAPELKLSCGDAHSQLEGIPLKVREGSFHEIFRKRRWVPQRASHTGKVGDDGSPAPSPGLITPHPPRPASSPFTGSSRKSLIPTLYSQPL